MRSSAPGDPLREPGLESLFESVRESLRENDAAVSARVHAQLCAHLCNSGLCPGLCNRLWVRKCFYFYIVAVCASVLEIKFVREMENQKLKDVVKELEIDTVL